MVLTAGADPNSDQNISFSVGSSNVGCESTLELNFFRARIIKISRVEGKARYAILRHILVVTNTIKVIHGR